jgi:serine/threonine protein kinase
MPTRTPFGKYDLLEKVAAGGMAEVWRARLRDGSGGGEILAVKRILPAIAADHNFITMFLNEARIAVQLSHPGVVQIRDLGEIDGSYFLAMEYVAGQNLRTIIDRTRQSANSWQLPLPFACHVVLRIAEALAYVHLKKDADGRDLNIVHRDVTPENVLVSYDGHVKLVDFGIAKAATASNMTRAGLIKGKLAYLSPEQSRGLVLDGRSDVFSLGAVLYELLTGVRIFLGDSEYATVMNVRERPIPRPSASRDRVPPELEAIVMKALARDLSTRYASAGEMAADIQVLLLKQTTFGHDDLSAQLRGSFPDEWEQEQRIAAEIASLPVTTPARAAPPPRPPPPIARPAPPVARPSPAAARPPPIVSRPLASGSPTIPMRAAGSASDLIELTEPGIPMRRGIDSTTLPPGPALPALPPVAPQNKLKRASSIKTMLIPLLRVTGVHRILSDRVPTDKELTAVASEDPPPAPLRPWLWALVGAFGAAFAVAAVFAPKLNHRAEKGVLVVNASPAEASVTLDGLRQKEPTPLVISLPAGLHEVDVEAPGFETFHAQVVVEAGSQETVNADLGVAGK